MRNDSGDPSTRRPFTDATMRRILERGAELEQLETARLRSPAKRDIEDLVEIAREAGISERNLRQSLEEFSDRTLQGNEALLGGP